VSQRSAPSGSTGLAVATWQAIGSGAGALNLEEPEVDARIHRHPDLPGMVGAWQFDFGPFAYMTKIAYLGIELKLGESPSCGRIVRLAILVTGARIWN